MLTLTVIKGREEEKYGVVRVAIPDAILRPGGRFASGDATYRLLGASRRLTNTEYRTNKPPAGVAWTALISACATAAANIKH